MIESIYGSNYRLLKDYILLIFFIFFSARFSFAQKSYDLNNIGFDDTKNIEEKYIYNSKLNKYIISCEVGDYPITRLDLFNEVKLIAGKHTREINGILGSKDYDEIIQRNNFLGLN